MLKVTNKHNNKSVVVRVNDRGPFVSARIIDLSQGAAEQLDMISTGTAPVAVESLEAIALPLDNGRPLRPPSEEILSPPAAPVPRASAASRPSAGRQYPAQGLERRELPVPSSASAVTPPASVPAPETVSVPETPAPVVADAFTSRPVETASGRASPVRQNQTPVEAPREPVSGPAPAVQPASLPPAEIKPGIPPAEAGKSYRIQVGAYKIPRHAVDAFDKLKNAGLNPAYERSGEVYRVVLAGIRAEDVESVAGKLGNAGFKEAVIREER
jgi:rare lipoprotein A